MFERIRKTLGISRVYERSSATGGRLVPVPEHLQATIYHAITKKLAFDKLKEGIRITREEKTAALKTYNDLWHAARTPEEKQAALEAYNEVYSIEDDETQDELRRWADERQAAFDRLKAALHCQRCGHRYKSAVARNEFTIEKLLQRHGNRCPALDITQRPGGCDGRASPVGTCSFCGQTCWADGDLSDCCLEPLLSEEQEIANRALLAKIEQ